MKRLLHISSILMVTLAIWVSQGCAATSKSSTSGEIEATTTRGEKVLLFPDGTWKYKEALILPQETPTEYITSKPDNAKAVLVSNKKFVSLWYDEDKWQILKSSPDPRLEFFNCSPRRWSICLDVRRKDQCPIDPVAQRNKPPNDGEFSGQN